MKVSLDELEQDAELSGPSSEQLAAVVALAKQMLEHEQFVRRAEEALKAEQEMLRQIKCVDLPNALLAAGLREFTLDSGEVISSEEKVYANISAERTAKAHAWLREYGYGDLIKNQITFDFKAGQEPEVLELLQAVQSHFPKVPFSRKEAVHPATLKVFVRERIAERELPREEGDPTPPEFPEELFGAHRANEAKVTRPASAKSRKR